MAENYEFIAAKDLPATEAEEVDVLCVDPTTGAMARKPGASLGGGAGGYVIKVPASEIDIETGEGTISESYDNFAEILYNGGSVLIDVSETMASVDSNSAGCYLVPIMWGANDVTGTREYSAVCLLGNVTLYLTFPNGTWTPPEE